MARLMSRAERIEKIVGRARQMAEALEDWRDAHPDASFGEIEAEARRQRRRYMGHVLEVVVNGRDVGSLLEAPRCAQCGREMDFEGYKARTLRGLEGDTTLERAYYRCPECEGQGFFPPGRTAPSAS